MWEICPLRLGWKKTDREREREREKKKMKKIKKKRDNREVFSLSIYKAGTWVGTNKWMYLGTYIR